MGIVYFFAIYVVVPRLASDVRHRRLIPRPNGHPESKKGNSRLEILVEYVGLTFLCILAHKYFEELNIGRMGLQA